MGWFKKDKVEEITGKMHIWEYETITYNLPENPDLLGKITFEANKNIFVINQRPNEQIIFGSILSSLGRVGYLQSMEIDNFIELTYVGITCTISTWMVTKVHGNITIV